VAAVPADNHAMTEARTTPLQPDELDDAQRAYLEAFTDRRGRYPNIFGVLCRNMPLMEAWRQFGLYAMRGVDLPANLREVLILRTAWNTACDYEWGQHERMARAAGLAEAVIGRLRAPWDQEPADDIAWMVRCADELASEQRLSDGTWSALTAARGLNATLDAIFVVGAYTALAMALKSCDVQLETRAAAPS
jgi:alkylhydroperoxidase family enzyme